MRSLELPDPARCFEKLAGSTTTWNQLDADCRQEQKRVLLENQSYRCAWCEKSIQSNSSHIDHVKSRNSTPNRIFDHSNIAASCGLHSADHCGHARSSNSIPDDIDLYRVDNVQQYFRVQADGTLVVEPGDLGEHIASTIDNVINIELKLNCKVLKGKRERRLSDLNSTLDGGQTTDELWEIYRNLDFVSLTEQVCGSQK